MIIANFRIQRSLSDWIFMLLSRILWVLCHINLILWYLRKSNLIDLIWFNHIRNAVMHLLRLIRHSFKVDSCEFLCSLFVLLLDLWHWVIIHIFIIVIVVVFELRHPRTIRCHVTRVARILLIWLWALFVDRLWRWWVFDLSVDWRVLLWEVFSVTFDQFTSKLFLNLLLLHRLLDLLLVIFEIIWTLSH